MSNIDPTQPEAGFATTESVRQNFQHAADEIDANAAAISVNATDISALDGRMDAVETKNAAQDGSINAINAEQVTQNDRLTATEARANDTVPFSTGGQFQAPAGCTVNGIDPWDYLRHDQIDQAIADAIAAIPPSSVEFPVGAMLIGFDPTGVFPGTWAQLPEGTFLMATVGGADPSGGSNDAVVPSHSHTVADPGHGHTASQAAHTHTAPQLTFPCGTSIPNYGVSGSGSGCMITLDSQAPAITVAGAGTGVTVNAEGVSPVGANRPKYVGVAVWQRTA